MSDTSEHAIRAADVRKYYEGGKVKALDGLTMEIGRGEFVAIMGPSGCGKSTLLHMVAALEAPTSGAIEVNGTDLRRIDDLNQYRRQEIGLVFQFHNLLPHLGSLENVEVAMLGSGLSRKERVSRAREMLDEVGLKGGEWRTPPKLSGGERQRVAIARALANRPGILLADEPTGSLDSVSSDNIFELFARLRQEHHMTIALVTHNPEVVDIVDRVLHMRDGHLVDGSDAD